MDWELILSLVFFAFCAGTIDAAVGGGGLIQIPALMGALPQTAPATLFGTNKLASIFGTGSAALSFVRRVKLQWSLLWVIAIFAKKVILSTKLQLKYWYSMVSVV